MWKPIINEHNELVYISEKLDNIYLALTKKINTINRFYLYSGKAGACLFLVYYQAMKKQRQNDIQDIVETIIEDTVQYRIKNLQDITLYAETAWFLCHLYERRLIDIDVDEYFSAIDKSLYEGMIMLLNKNEYGFFNGAISIGLYFYNSYLLGNENCKKYLEHFVDLLYNTRIEKDNTIGWTDIINYETNERGYNLGIAHGIPGVLLFLKKLYHANIKRDIVAELIIKASNFLLLQKHSLKTHKSFFHNTYSEFSSGSDTRLGWCYGDLSVGYALLAVSSLNGIERKDVKENALDILINTTGRTNVRDSRTIDAGLCHGAAGIAHIYNRLYHQTSEPEFRNAAMYWYKETIKMAKYDSEYAGFRFPHSLEEPERDFLEMYNLSFLAGISGVGLSLLSAVYPIEPSWDMCLLLS